MASRAKKKTASPTRATSPAIDRIGEAKPAVPSAWVWIMLAVIVAAFAFSFIPSYDVQATVDLDLGEESAELFDDEDFHIGAAVLDILFAPVGGYEDAAHWLVDNFPATADSETMQSLAEAYMESYPQQLLDKLDAAFAAIYFIEVAVVAVTVAYIVGFIVLGSVKGTNKHLAALVMTAVATFVALVRTVFAIAVYSQSTKEFVLTAGGGSWLTFVAFAAALAALAATYVRDKKRGIAS